MEPDYPTVGFAVCRGRGPHVKLDGALAGDLLFTAPLRRGDGTYLELGYLEVILYLILLCIRVLLRILILTMGPTSSWAA